MAAPKLSLPAGRRDRRAWVGCWSGRRRRALAAAIVAGGVDGARRAAEPRRAGSRSSPAARARSAAARRRGAAPGCAMRSSSRAQARSPSRRIGWCTVVSDGSNRLPGKMSSKPTTATSSGHPHAGRGEGLEDADRHLVVRADDGVRQVVAAVGEQSARPPPRRFADAEDAPVGADDLGVRVGGSTTASSASRRSLASGASGGPSTWNIRRRPWSAMRWVTRAAEPDRLSAVTTSTPARPGRQRRRPRAPASASRASIGGARCPRR